MGGFDAYIAACTTSGKGDERKMVLPLISKTTLNQLKCHVTLTRSMVILEADTEDMMPHGLGRSC